MPEKTIVQTQYMPGYVVETDQSGNSTKRAIADMLRSADIPTGLTYEQVSAVTTLANLFAVLVRTLIDRGVLDESFMEGSEYSLDDLIEAVESLGGAYHEPDISVT